MQTYFELPFVNDKFVDLKFHGVLIHQYLDMINMIMKDGVHFGIRHCWWDTTSILPSNFTQVYANMNID